MIIFHYIAFTIILLIQYNKARYSLGNMKHG